MLIDLALWIEQRKRETCELLALRIRDSKREGQPCYRPEEFEVFCNDIILRLKAIEHRLIEGDTRL